MTDTFHRVADFALNRGPEDMPASARDAAALMVLDTMGILIASAPMEAGVIARDTAALLYASTDPRFSARMLFDGRQVSLAGAAYAAATQTDNLDGHDGYNPTKGHIGVVVVPALAVLAQHCPDLTGPEALAAVIVGYEIAGRAGIALHATVSDYHTSGAWNALGVAAMAARLRGHSPDQLRQALGIAEYHGPRSQMMREIANPTMLHDGSGWGVMVGMSAAVLAERGFTGAPAITIEEDRAAPFWQDLGRFWQMEHQYVKPYPICRWAHAAIDATRALMQAHDLTHRQIRHLQVNSFHEAACLYPGIPATTSQAQYSLAFAVAVQAVHGRIGVEHISGGGLSDPTVAGFLQRIAISESPRHSARFPDGRWADVQITTTDGRVLDSGDTHARGGPEAPMSRQDVIGKYLDFAAPAIGEARAAAIRDAILGLTDPDSRFSDLAGLLYDPAKSRDAVSG
ncbi:2-methylcitrate dehydratase [Ruegeria marisrubri]|uniref:2-methylcitrate dehydratase n=1 Tax=Ruegeria marisrubri TaxID=1685379 RepID=A0A0X3TL71_9RHOB|nr:MmgE/PrpD family protein [Ruegeria marisrubri]KUJ76488.1 2-methylcitrate dehydratase [Ruegeria marisrubri]